MERDWLGDYLAKVMATAPPVQAELDRVEQPQPSPQGGPVQVPMMSGSVTVPLPTGEVFARGLYNPEDPRRPQYGVNFGYRMRF